MPDDLERPPLGGAVPEPDDASDDTPRSLSVPRQAALPPAKREGEASAPRKRHPRPPVPPQTVVVQEQRGCMSTCALGAAVVAIVGAIVLGIMALAFTDQLTDFGDDLRTFLGLEDATPEVVDTQIIVLGIRTMALLQTTSGDLLIEKEVVEDQPLRKDPFVKMRYIGRITAGIDLGAINEGDIVVESADSVRVTLPPAHLTGCFLENAVQLDASCGTTFLGLTSCTDKINQLQQVAQRRAKEDLIDMASELTLVEQAYDAAEGAISALLTDLGFESIQFARSTAEAAADPSCEP